MRSYSNLIVTSLFVIPIIFLFTFKTFIDPSCFSFDSHDDANHAFPNLSLAIESLKNFKLPLFNFYNNFGVPLLGDALTYPFSIQSITYYFFEDFLAMSINRIFFSISTFFIAIKFLKLHGVNKLLPVLALLIVFIPVNFWYPVHHYQGNLFFYLLNFILIDRYLKNTNNINLLILFLSFCFYLLSVSINLIILSAPFYLIWLYFFFDKNIKYIQKIFLIALSSFFITMVQHYEFFISYLTSGRLSESVYYTILHNFRDLFLGILYAPGDWIPWNYGAQLQVTSYISLPIIISSLAAYYYSKNKVIFYCGIIPSIISIFLYYQYKVWLNIPVLKNIDILRILWFSMPFVIVASGIFIKNVGKINKSILQILIFLLTIAIFLYFSMPESKNTSLIYLFQFIFLFFSLCVIYLLNFKNKQTFFSVFISLSLLLTLIPTIHRVIGIDRPGCIGTQYYSPIEAAKLEPNIFLDSINRNERVATEIHTHKGQDTRATKHRIFGSNARGIVVDKNFGNILEKRGLIHIDQVPYGYYFKSPWNFDLLNRLGIAYLITKEIYNQEELTLVDSYQNHYLYRNNNAPSIAYIVNKENKIISFIEPHLIEVTAQTLSFNVSSIDDNELYIAINNRDNLYININNKPVPKLTNELNLIRVSLPAGDHEIKLEYKTSQMLIYLFMMIGFFILIYISINYKLNEKKSI